MKIIWVIYFISFLWGASIPSVFLVNLEAWSWIRAERRFLSQVREILVNMSFVKVKLFRLEPYNFATSARTPAISLSLGAGTLIFKHLDLIGWINLCTLLQSSIILQFLTYFSIVLLSPPCASLVNLSASLMIKTLNPFPLLDSILLFDAISLTTFWTIWRSW